MTKSPNEIDKHVGSRVRMRRMLLGMSQERLGQALGVTFQQVQKYEKGVNRIGASRLQQLSDVLEVPPSYFFDSAETRTANGGLAEAPSTFTMSDIVPTAESLMLLRTFLRIQNPRLRRRVLDLVVALAEEKETESSSPAAAAGPGQS